MTLPRLAGLTISPKVPAPIVSGQPPNVPLKNRKTIKAAREGESAAAILKTV
ncbi:unnamed protein product [Periconia digitata]|uniref:Uncharacterized protein n=1 Tax=Periconia digitata TaxID=1303443 RepID=A0A9W4U8V0_9PLEO|nr:unnamed protein product [Periconia digitata]